MNLYIGTSGFSYKEWKGSFYPEKLPERQMLQFYGQCFRTVEINLTFRGIPATTTLEKWAETVPAEFKFALKAPMQITHRKRLKDADETLNRFVEVVETLASRLGPILFQLPPTMKKDAARLGAFLALLPARHRMAFEFRHQSWFDEEVFALLREHRCAMCLAEAENDLEVPFVATADWGYMRLREPEYSDKELKAWLERVRAQDWRDAFVFLKHDDEGKGPQMAKRLMELAA
jgi:uncharacterized protein YecE (DUF72 family)